MHAYHLGGCTWAVQATLTRGFPDTILTLRRTLSTVLAILAQLRTKPLLDSSPQLVAAALVRPALSFCRLSVVGCRPDPARRPCVHWLMLRRRSCCSSGRRA
jgi:hypothetical protein